MNDVKDYAIGAGAGYLAYKGTKKIAFKPIKKYGSFALGVMSDYSKNENEQLKDAAYKGWVQSGLKSKKIYLHNIDKQNVKHIERLMYRKVISIVKNKLHISVMGPKEQKEFMRKINGYLKNKDYKKAWEAYKELWKNKKTFSKSGLNSAEKIIKNLSAASVQNLDEIIKNGKFNYPDDFKLDKKTKEILKEILSSPKIKSGQGFKKIEKFEKYKKIFKIFKPDSGKDFSNILGMVAKGKNAFYSPATRDIVINMDKIPGAVFHEMGHALNATGSKAIKTLAFGRHITAAFAPLVLLVGLFKNKKSDGEKTVGFKDKVTTFIKNNTAVLTFAALLPTLAEEGLASIRGKNIAKNILSPALLKKVNKANAFAWGSYLLGAAATTAAAKIGVEVRDKIVEKTQKKLS